MSKTVDMCWDEPGTGTCPDRYPAPAGYHWELDSDTMYATRWVLVKDSDTGMNSPRWVNWFIFSICILGMAAVLWWITS